MPNPGRRERRLTPHGRRASDALKMTCPFCGACASAVVRSEGRITTDRVRRRRECVSCGERFPSSEKVDWDLLRAELAAAGRQLEFPLSVVAWDQIEALLHQAWGQAKDGHYDKPTWKALQLALDDWKRRAV